MDKKTVAIIILSSIVCVLTTIIVASTIIGKHKYGELEDKYEKLRETTNSISGNLDNIGTNLDNIGEIESGIEEGISGAIDINQQIRDNTDRAGELNREAKDIIEELRRRNEQIAAKYQ